MQTIQRGYRGISLIMSLNWDRILYVATCATALAFGAWIGSL